MARQNSYESCLTPEQVKRPREDFFAGKDKEQMRLTEGGRVGIGTDNPQAKLDVAGVIRVSEGIKFSDGTTLNSKDGKLNVRDANGDDIAQDNEIGPSNNALFGAAPNRHFDPQKGHKLYNRYLDELEITSQRLVGDLLDVFGVADSAVLAHHEDGARARVPGHGNRAHRPLPATRSGPGLEPPAPRGRRGRHAAA